MNLYILDQNPTRAAQFLGDKHSSRAIVEGTQMLVNCFPESLLKLAPRTAKGTVRRHAYRDDRCAMWARQRLANAVWVLEHAIACEAERHYRFPHVLSHPCVPFLEWVSENTHSMEFSDPDTARRSGRTPFVQQMHHAFKRTGDPVSAYRLFYLVEKEHILKWTKRGEPAWVDELYRSSVAFV